MKGGDTLFTRSAMMVRRTDGVFDLEARGEGGGGDRRDGEGVRRRETEIQKSSGGEE